MAKRARGSPNIMQRNYISFSWKYLDVETHLDIRYPRSANTMKYVHTEIVKMGT